jgi:hypothetical protein
LQQFYAAHKDDSDFLMVGIVRDDTTSQVRKFVDANKVGWTVALDPKNEATLAFATRGQPETYAISPGGVVAAANIGPMSAQGLESFLAAARASG